MNHFDVAIIGSGPSGTSTAYELAKNGISTVIIEKEILPRYKTCGGGFVYRGLRNMPFDIEEIIDRKFYNVDIYLEDKYHFVTKRKQPTISMVMRDEFDYFLSKKAKEVGVEILEGNPLKSLDFSNDKIIATTSRGQISTKFVIAADGALSPTAKMAGWKNDTRKLIPALEYEVEVSDEEFKKYADIVRFDFDIIPFGYAWSFPKKHHLSLGAASARRTKINLKKYYKEYVEYLGIKEIISEKQYGFQIPVSPRTDGFVKNNVFLIGDAAGFPDPLTAEGISNAIYSGRIVANSLIEAKLDSKLAEKLYNQKLQEKLLPELKVGLWLSKFFYEQKKARNLLMPKYGQRFSDAMTDFLMGDREYPQNISKLIQQKVKELIF